MHQKEHTTLWSSGNMTAIYKELHVGLRTQSVCESRTAFT